MSYYEFLDLLKEREGAGMQWYTSGAGNKFYIYEEIAFLQDKTFGMDDICLYAEGVTFGVWGQS